jgi:hypothetical protein
MQLTGILLRFDGSERLRLVEEVLFLLLAHDEKRFRRIRQSFRNALKAAGPWVLAAR